jgi:transposase
MKFLLIARRSDVKSRTQTINKIWAILITAPDDIRLKYLKSSQSACIERCINMTAMDDSTLVKK